MSNLEEKFTEIENRVKALVDKNRSNKKRVRELEKELIQTHQVAQKSATIHDKQLHLRQKVEKILRDLEGVEIKKTDEVN